MDDQHTKSAKISASVGDVIYRQDAINAINECHPHCVVPDDYHISIVDAEFRLRKVPSAEKMHNRITDRRILTEDDYTYCAECDHVEVCGWYPMYGCEFKSKTPSEPEIIRCKDCEYGSPDGKWGCDCYHWKRYETHEMQPDDFCSKGKKK